jgi:hypothetical protein
MTRYARVSMAAVAVLLAWPLSLSAQSLKGLEGKKVRLTSAVLENDLRAGAVVVQGTVFEVRGDSVHIMQDGGMPAHVSLSSIRTLDVHGGKDHGRGAYRGAMVGAAIGLVLSAMPPDCNNGYGLDCRADGSKPTYAEYAWSNVAAWAFMGSMFGAIRGVDRWSPVITPQRVTISKARDGGIRVGVGLTF